MKFDLIYGRFASPRLLEFLEVRDRPVAEADGFHATRSKDVFHLSPGLAEIPIAVDCSAAIRVDREKFGTFILPAVRTTSLAWQIAAVSIASLNQEIV